MSAQKRQQPHHTPGPEHPQHRPAWQRMHRSPFFWIAFIFLAVAMTVYVMTNNLSTVPGKKAGDPVPALAP